MILAGRSVAELCNEYATLDAARAALDQQIHRIASAPPEDETTDSDSETGVRALGNMSREANSDTLWLELEDLLVRRGDVVTALADTKSGTVQQLLAKAEVLETLLRLNHENPQEADLTRYLTLSLIGDITGLLS